MKQAHDVAMSTTAAKLLMLAVAMLLLILLVLLKRSLMLLLMTMLTPSPRHDFFTNCRIASRAEYSLLLLSR
jgi:hypothetical protein